MNRSEHIPALDGIRGLAVLLVILFHCMHMEHAGSGVDAQVYRLSAACWCGVDLFFVLSGFLITGILIDAKEGKYYFRNFYARRVLRIFPLYYGLLLVKLVIVPAISGAPAASHHADIWYWLYLPNWAQGIGAGLHHGLGLTWTLAIEEQFYLFWPLIVYVCDRRTLGRICVAMVAAAILFRVTIDLTLNLPMGHELTPARIDSLALGALAAVLVREVSTRTIQRYAKMALAAGGLVLAGIFARDGFWAGPGWMNRFGLTAWGTVFAGLVIFAATLRGESKLVRGLSARPLLMLGKFSYAIYLLHATIDGGLMHVMFGDRPLPRVWGSQIPAQLGYYVVLILVCVIAGWCSWNVYEKWFLRLKAYFAYEPRAAGSIDERQTEPREFLTSPQASAAG